MLLRVPRPRGPYVIAHPVDKLVARGALPGAFGYDQAAHTFRRAVSAGMSPAELLAPALPCSWMVNARASSPVFARWLRPPLRGAWADLIELLAVASAGWRARDDTARAKVTALVTQLAIDGQGATAISKVAALLCPDAVPLMDDAAAWFALDALACPTAPADQAPATVGPAVFVPMLDWFAGAVLDAHEPLAELAEAYPLAPLSPAQVLDRLIWFETWGFRHTHAGPADSPRARWWHVIDDRASTSPREAIVPVAGPHPANHPPHEPLDLAAVPDAGFRDRALRALDAALAD